MEEKADESDFNISGKDLKKIKFSQRKILCDRSICKDYLEQTKQTFDEIKENVSEKQAFAGKISKVSLIGVGGKIFFIAALIITPSLEY